MLLVRVRSLTYLPPAQRRLTDSPRFRAAGECRVAGTRTGKGLPGVPAATKKQVRPPAPARRIPPE
jgi:hypothetical protein